MIEELPISTTQVIIIIMVMGVLFVVLGIQIAQQITAFMEDSSISILPNRYIVYTHYV